MVNKERIQLWVDALRSGEYRQATGALQAIPKGWAIGEDEKGYCCLGVACEVALRTDPDSLHPDLWPAESQSLVDYWGNLAHLPPEVVDWYGLPSPDPMLPYLKPTDDDEMASMSAAELNDDYDFDFSEIADAIELQFLKGEVKDGESGSDAAVGGGAA